MWKKQKMEVAKEQCIHDQAAKAQGWRFFLAGFFLTVLITGIGFACLTVWPDGIDYRFAAPVPAVLYGYAQQACKWRIAVVFLFRRTWLQFLVNVCILSGESSEFSDGIDPDRKCLRFYGSDDPFENRSVRRMLCLVSAQTGSEAALSSGRIWCDVCPEQFCDRVLF